MHEHRLPLDGPSSAQLDDPIGPGYCPGSVGDHDAGSSGEVSIDEIVHRFRRGRIEVARGLIEHQRHRGSEQRPRHRDPLTLTGRQARASRTELGVVPFGQTLHECLDSGLLRRLEDAADRGVEVAIAEVLQDRAAEEDRVRLQDWQMTPHRTDVVLGEGDGIE